MLLVLLSVVLGARVVASADRTQAWLVATRPLPAGHVLARDDVGSTRAHLDHGTGGHYYLAARAPALVGGQLARPLSPGELVGEHDFVQGRVVPTRVVPVLVRAGRAPGLRRGDRVDVYVFQRWSTAPARTGPAGGVETRVLHDVEFLDEDELASGDRSLRLRVPVDAAIAAVAASQTERVDVVRIDRGGRGESGGAGPATVPGYGS